MTRIYHSFLFIQAAVKNVTHKKYDFHAKIISRVEIEKFINTKAH